VLPTFSEQNMPDRRKYVPDYAKLWNAHYIRTNLVALAVHKFRLSFITKICQLLHKSGEKICQTEKIHASFVKSGIKICQLATVLRAVLRGKNVLCARA
jgi:hypothetical protein